MHFYPQPVLQLASYDALRDLHRIYKIWLIMRNTDIPTRQWHEEIAFAIYEYKDTILDAEGHIWLTPNLVNILGSSRWLYSFLGKKRNWRRTTTFLSRLQMIDLYFQITKPHLHRYLSAAGSLSR